MSPPVDPDAQPTFLHRWSLRKRGADGEHADEREAPPQASLADDEPAPATARSPERYPEPDLDPNLEPNLPARAPVPTDADMPPLESLDERSDLSGFLGDGVSAALRKAALRRVFSGAAFNVRDGLNDYDGDFTAFEPLGDIVTADMKFHTARRERLVRERAEAEALADDVLQDPDADAAIGDTPDEACKGPEDKGQRASGDPLCDEATDGAPDTQGGGDPDEEADGASHDRRDRAPVVARSIDHDPSVTARDGEPASVSPFPKRPPA